MMAEESQFMLKCTNMSENQLKTINLVRSITAAITMAILLLIIVLIICYRLYGSVVKRLFLYLVVITTLKEAIHFASIERQWKYRAQNTYCTWHGYFQNVTLLAVLLLSLSLILCLLHRVCKLIKGNIISQSKSRELGMEIMYATTPIVIVLVYSLGPLFRGRYGLAGTWCWIQGIDLDDDDNCSAVGLVDQLVFGHGVFEIIGVVATLITIVNIFIYRKLSTVFQDARVLLKKTLLLTGCLLIRILFVTFVLTARVLRATKPKINMYSLSVTQALATPLSDLIFPLGFLFFFYSVRKSFAFAINCFVKCYRGKRQLGNGYLDLEKSFEVETSPVSTRKSQPSESYFQISYTGNFTSISSEAERMVADNYRQEICQSTH